MMRRQIKRIIDPFLKAGLRWYRSKSRPFRYGELKIMVHPEVFPPFFTLSTKVLLRYMEQLELKEKRLLELGCGSGIISLFARQKGALVTSSDINPKALEMLWENALTNSLELEIIHSDLFENLTERSFDYIIINPPYYPKAAMNMEERAWFCGEQFEYFHALFEQLPTYLNEQNHTLMILSQDCQISTIQTIAAQFGIGFQETWSGKIKAENNYIFRLIRSQNNNS